MKSSLIVFVLGFPLTIIASIMNFLISYREYQRHFPERKKAIEMSIESGLFTFVFFVVLLFFIGFVLNKMFF